MGSVQYDIIFNDMGYTHEILGQFYSELEGDFICDYEPKVSLKHYPSCVDWNMIIIEIIISAVPVILEQILIKLPLLLKKTSEVRNKEGKEPKIEVKIIMKDCTIIHYATSDPILPDTDIVKIESELTEYIKTLKQLDPEKNDSKPEV